MTEKPQAEWLEPMFRLNDDPTWRAQMERSQREWCAKKNDGMHRHLVGSRTCIDCGQDLDL